MQKLPEFMAPNVRYARKLHKIEKKNYVHHWMKAKKALDAGTGLVRPNSVFDPSDCTNMFFPSHASAMTFTGPKQLKSSPMTLQHTSAAHFLKQDPIPHQGLSMAIS